MCKTSETRELVNKVKNAILKLVSLVNKEVIEGIMCVAVIVQNQNECFATALGHRADKTL